MKFRSTTHRLPTLAGTFHICGAGAPVFCRLTRSKGSKPATCRRSGLVVLLSALLVLQAPAASFVTTGSLNTARQYHTATLLPNGKVLVAGGYNGAYLSSAELYDPAIGAWAPTGALAAMRELHTATLLPDGKVLATGGYTNPPSGEVASSELYDIGLGFAAASQPQIATCTSPLALGGSLALTGSGFRGVSEGSCGGTQDSPGDYPLVQLRSLEGGQSLFLLATNWQTNAFNSAPVGGLPPGYALATAFVNGSFSTGSVVNVSVPFPTTTTLTGAKWLTNGAFQLTFTNSAGTLFGVLAATNPLVPLSEWTLLSGVTEMSPGQFQFTDPQATNTARLYRIRSL